MARLYLLLTLTILFVAIETKEELNLDDVTAIVGEKFDYQIGDEKFLSTYKIYRIVQRGQRKLPGWLTFDSNSSMLIGYPKMEDVGMYTIRLRAQCIDPAVTKCQAKLSRTFHISVMEPLKSAESRGRHSFSKHEKNGKRIDTNMHNGNTRLYVEYDITRHGTVVDRTSGMLVSCSEHVLSMSAFYSAMQSDDFATYLHNKNMHDKLSSKSYLAMQYKTAPNSVSHTYLNEQFSKDVYSSMQYGIYFDIDSIHKSDRHSVELYSSMQYTTDIYNIHNSDFHEKFPSYTKGVLQYKQLFTTDRDFPILDKSKKIPKNLYFTKTYGANMAKASNSNKKESPEKQSADTDIAWKYADESRSSQKHEELDVQAPVFCQRDQTVFYASLILYIISNLTNAQKDMIISKWSKFISKNPDMVFISRTDPNIMSMGYSGKYILTAGPGNVIESLSDSVELSWHIACEIFEQVHDFTRILQHNIEVGRVSEEIGLDVIAWFVYTDRPLPKRVRRQAHSARRKTATPTFSPPVPTTLSEMLTSTTESSLYSSSNSMSTNFATLSSTFTSLFTLPPTSVFSLASSFKTVSSFSTLNTTYTSTTELVIFSGTYSPGFSSVFTKSILSSFTSSAISKTFSRSPTAFSSSETSLESFTTSLSPAFSSLTYPSFRSTSVMPSTFSYLPTSTGISSTVNTLSTLGLSSSAYTDSSFGLSSKTFSSIESIYASSFSNIFTSFISSFSDASSSEFKLTPFSKTSIMKTLDTSDIQKSMSKLESSLYTSSFSEGIKYTSVSVMSSVSASGSGEIISLSYFDSLSSTLSSLPSSVKLTSTAYSVDSSTSFIGSTKLLDSSMTFSSFLPSVPVSALTSFFYTMVSSSSSLSSELSSFGLIFSSSVSSTSVIYPSFLSKASSTAILSTLESDTGMSFSSSSLINSTRKSAFMSSYTSLSLMSSSEYIIFQSASNITIYSISMTTSLFLPTTGSTPYLTMSFSTSTYLAELFSPSPSSVSTHSTKLFLPSPSSVSTHSTKLFLPSPSSVSTHSTKLFSPSPSSMSTHSTKLFQPSSVSVSAYSPILFPSTSLSMSTYSVKLLSPTSLSISTYSELFSPTFFSTFSPEKSVTRYKSSMFLSSSVVSRPNFSSVETTPEIISTSLDVMTLSSFPTSETLAKESSTFELTPSLPVFSTSDSLDSASATLVSKSSVLSALPSTEESSMVSTLVPSMSISPTRVSSIYSLTSVWSTRVVSTAAPDEAPSLKKSIDHLRIIVGRYFEFQIPVDTFSDKEDGNTRNLSLRISLTYSKPFPEDAWLMFNETSQTFYGIPLKNDSVGENVLSEFTLIAKDSQGQVAKDAISLTYEYEKDVNHRISVTLNGSYDKFIDDRMNLIQVAQSIANFYGDESINFLSFSSVEKGSVVIIWSNNTLIGTICYKNKIRELYNRISDDNETISDQFLALFTNHTPINTSLELFGVCLLPVTSLAPPTKSPISETDNKMWIEIVLPALIAILVIVIIALLLLICCRHRRPSKEIKDSNKPAFLEDRRPIIFPEELEMVDPSLKPKRPLVLPSDYLTETPPAVPAHGRPTPPYHTPMLDDDRFPGEDEEQPPPPEHGRYSNQSEPPPYRLPPPYYNPHRMA